MPSSLFSTFPQILRTLAHLATKVGEKCGLGVFVVVGFDDSVNTAAYVKITFDVKSARLHRSNEIVENLVRDGLVVGPFVPVGPQIKLKRFELHAVLVGDIANTNGGEVGLSRYGTDTGELRTLHANFVIPLGVWVSERS